MPSGEFQRVVRDLAVLGDTATIGVSKEGVRFAVSGDLGACHVPAASGSTASAARRRAAPQRPRPALTLPHPTPLPHAAGTGNIVRKQNTSADKAEARTSVEMEEPTELQFALQYLNHFTKATPLSDTVKLHLSKEVPLMVEYKVEGFGHMRFYLAPKIEEDAS